MRLIKPKAASGSQHDRQTPHRDKPTTANGSGANPDNSEQRTPLAAVPSALRHLSNTPSGDSENLTVTIETASTPGNIPVARDGSRTERRPSRTTKAEISAASRSRDSNTFQALTGADCIDLINEVTAELRLR